PPARPRAAAPPAPAGARGGVGRGAGPRGPAPPADGPPSGGAGQPNGPVRAGSSCWDPFSLPSVCPFATLGGAPLRDRDVLHNRTGRNLLGLGSNPSRTPG